jgi:choline dehydrogenase
MAVESWSARNWGFSGNHNSHLNGRSMPLPMGKVLRGGPSINLMVWSHGRKHNWDFFADEVADTAWDYESVLDIYRRIEDWHGVPDARYHGIDGPGHVRSRFLLLRLKMAP